MCFSSSKTQNTTSVSGTSIDPTLAAAGVQVGTNASNYTANSPYQGYTGPTEGAFGSTFGTAENNETNLASQPNANYTAAGSTLGTGTNLAATTASTPVSALMSQYTGAALDPTIQAIQRQATAANQGLATNATMAGAFGDTGYGTQKANQDYNTTQQIGDATASAYNTAYNNALSTQQTALSQLLSGGSAQSGLGSNQSASGTAANQLLGSLGSTVQSANQTGINTAINVNQSNHLGQLQQDALAGSTLSAVPKDTLTSGNSNTVSTQPDNTGLGLLGTLLAAA